MDHNRVTVSGAAAAGNGFKRPAKKSSGKSSSDEALFKSAFRKGDMIAHPTYGEERITKIQPMQSRADLIVRFDLAGEKKLDESWVLLHCAHNVRNGVAYWDFPL